MAHQVLINGHWKDSSGSQLFQAVNPVTEELLPGEFPLSPWEEIDQALEAAAEASRQMRGWDGSRFAEFLDAYAEEIEARADDLVAAANAETALPVSPRLRDGELPRTTNQLRQAAEAARSSSWSVPTIDTGTGIRSVYGPIGPVVVFGPNNFPFAFNGIAGGDYAAAIAAGNPVIAKAHRCHPSTTARFARLALAAAKEARLPDGADA